MWSLAILISSYTALAVGQADDAIEKEHVDIEWEQIDTTGVSVNTNEGFGHEANETDTPHLSVQVNFGESGDENEKGVTENEENYKDDGVNDIYLPLDPFTLHHPFIRPEVTEFEYSDWYFLFFSPATKTSSSPIDISSASPEIAASLSSKLSVPSSMFSINSLDKYKSNSISANLSLMSHSIPKLHHNLCNLQNKSPIFWIRGTEFRLVQIFHDKNQHLYINNKEVSKDLFFLSLSSSPIKITIENPFPIVYTISKIKILHINKYRWVTFQRAPELGNVCIFKLAQFSKVNLDIFDIFEIIRRFFIGFGYALIKA